MHHIALIALLCVPLFAGFFPSKVETSIKSVEGNTITLHRKFPIAGMSGVVVHNYGNGLNAIISRIKQPTTQNRLTLFRADVIDHESLPSIKTSVAPKDKVIGGYLYENVLLLAPDANTYAKITSSYDKTWIHPDLFAVYLSVIGDEIPTKENLAKFAKKFQVGLVYIVGKENSSLFDPISGQIIAQKSSGTLPNKGQFPFYMRLKPLGSGWFGTTSDTKGNYYKMIQSL